ncbi:hypothetical protein EIN_432730 [Entamoeba invadens IP1]|uniref:Tail specific protease domain-containing protein n=1 Tax=Entamoeba invadens IP1 TaxID=370355 RepID=A0A0A1UCR3_ENTIV|nr:hypothetical protein EIN_432730 [Entamoeba invadens IP1]ELP93711.1 hypothetical protein EIN_432730 [Entamoeba invadens IP1]|eukprot:XP_004260482.1 hypothetical protein EIN_432730 [Entamoeba invadens IP1]
MLIFLFLVISVFSKCETNICSPADAISEMKTDLFPKADALIILDRIDEYLGAYAFRDTAKNPPQPPSRPTYHKKFDIDAEIAKIRINVESAPENVNFYDFFVSLQKLVKGPSDLHLSLKIADSTNYKITQFYTMNPINFVFKGKDVYLRVVNTILGLSPQRIFGQEIITSLNEKMNNNSKIIKINGVDATQFLSNYALKYYRLKNENGAIAYMKQLFEVSLYSSFPYEENDLKFVLTFSDNTSVSFNSVLYYLSPSLFKSNDEAMKIKRVIDQKTKNERDRVSNNEVIAKIPFEITNTDFAPKLKGENVYEYTLPNIISCTKRVIDDINMNILVVNSFSPTKVSDFITTADNCMKFFDTNTHPILVVLPNNGGGYVSAEDYLYKLLFPSTYYTKRYIARINETTEKVMKGGFVNSLIDPLTNTLRSRDQQFLITGKLTEWYSNPQTDTYGDVLYTHTQPSYLNSPSSGTYQMKNVRKSNEIIVMTDHFCFSACSLFAKNVVEKKSAITATYSGLPTSTFRVVGESPTVVIKDEEITRNYNVDLGTFGLSMKISFMPSLPSDESDFVPNEYRTHQPEEYVDIDSFEDTESSVMEFIKAAIQIYENHQIQCNDNQTKKDDRCKESSDSESWGSLCINGVFNPEQCEFIECREGYIRDNNKCITANPQPNDDQETSNQIESHDQDTSPAFYIFLSLSFLLFV